VVPRFREGHWSELEIEILREAGVSHPDTVRRKLKLAGFKRTATAILLKQKHLRILREIDDNGKFTATSLGEIFGVDRDTVRGWVNKGLLAGNRLRSFAGAEKAPAHDKAWWQFTRREVRQFVIDNVAVVDFHRVDKFWLVDLLTESGGLERP
jgi:hypothetical protein